MGSDVVVNGDDGENEWDVYVGGSILFKYDDEGVMKRKHRDKHRETREKENPTYLYRRKRWTELGSKLEKIEKRERKNEKGKIPRLNARKRERKDEQKRERKETLNEKGMAQRKTNGTEKKES